MSSAVTAQSVCIRSRPSAVPCVGLDISFNLGVDQSRRDVGKARMYNALEKNRHHVLHSEIHEARVVERDLIRRTQHRELKPSDHSCAGYPRRVESQF